MRLAEWLYLRKDKNISMQKDDIETEVEKCGLNELVSCDSEFTALFQKFSFLLPPNSFQNTG